MGNYFAVDSYYELGRAKARFPKDIKWYFVSYNRSDNRKKNGLQILPHRNTFKRKRPESRWVRVLYWRDDELILEHTEPLITCPSDELITKLMLVAL